MFEAKTANEAMEAAAKAIGYHTYQELSEQLDGSYTLDAFLVDNRTDTQIERDAAIAGKTIGVKHRDDETP